MAPLPPLPPPPLDPRLIVDIYVINDWTLNEDRKGIGYLVHVPGIVSMIILLGRKHFPSVSTEIRPRLHSLRTPYNVAGAPEIVKCLASGRHGPSARLEPKKHLNHRQYFTISN